MCTNDILTAIADDNGEISITSAKAILKELNLATVALRRINFLSKTFNTESLHLKEIAKISGDILNKE